MYSKVGEYTFSRIYRQLYALQLDFTDITDSTLPVFKKIIVNRGLLQTPIISLHEIHVIFVIHFVYISIFYGSALLVVLCHFIR